jgi:uncharacterized membrane protein
MKPLTIQGLLTLITYMMLGIVAFIVVVGGICVLVPAKGYTFSEYISDVAGLWKLILSAVATLAGKVFIGVAQSKEEGAAKTMHTAKNGDAT